MFNNKEKFAFILVGVAAINIFRIGCKLSKRIDQKQEYSYNKTLQNSNHHYYSDAISDNFAECPIEYGYLGEAPLECFP